MKRIAMAGIVVAALVPTVSASPASAVSCSAPPGAHVIRHDPSVDIFGDGKYGRVYAKHQEQLDEVWYVCSFAYGRTFEVWNGKGKRSARNGGEELDCISLRPRSALVVGFYGSDGYDPFTVNLRTNRRRAFHSRSTSPC